MVSDPSVQRAAVISSCGLYRYRLERTWGDAPPLAFVMLNPSTADANIDDPTIRRCMGFARREGTGGVVVVNLFGLRAADPRALKAARDRRGPENQKALEVVIKTGLTIVCAWGAHPLASGFFAREFVRDAKALGARDRIMCLGRAKGGAPRHPLYVRADQPLEAFLS